MKYELRNYSFGQTVGKGLNLFFDNFFYVAGVSLIFNLPTFYLYFFWKVPKTEGFNVIPFYRLLSFIIIGYFLSAFITHVVSKKYLGKTLSIGDYFLTRFPLLLSVLFLSLMVNLPFISIFPLSLLGKAWIGLGFFLLFIPWLILITGLSVSVNVLVVECVSLIESLRRSWRLTKGKRWFIFLLLLLLKIILLSIAYGFLILKSKIGLDRYLATLTMITASVLFNAMISCVFVVVYYNLRIEKEGFGVEHLAEQFSLTETNE